jgi:hypothetical protein
MTSISAVFHIKLQRDIHQSDKHFGYVLDKWRCSSRRRRDGEIFSNSDCAAAVVQDLDCLEPKNLVSKYKTQKKEHT